MVYLLILLLLALVGFLLLSRKQGSTVSPQQVLPPQQKEQSVQEIPVKTESAATSVQLPKSFEETPVSQKPVEEFTRATHAPAEDKKIAFEDIQNPTVAKPVAPVLGAKEQKPMQEEIAKVASVSDEKAAQEEAEEATPTLSIFRRKKIEEPVEPVTKEEKQKFNEAKGEAAFKDLEKEFRDKERLTAGEVSLPSLQDFQKAPGERIEAISPVLHSAVVDEEDEESKPSIENIEEIVAPIAEKEEVVSAEKKVKAPQQEVQVIPETVEPKVVEEKRPEEVVVPTVQKEEVSKKKEHPEFKKGAHFVPQDFGTFAIGNHFAPEDFEDRKKTSEAERPIQQEFKPAQPIHENKTMKILPDSLTEDNFAEKIVEEEAPKNVEGEQAAEQDFGKQTGGRNTLKRNFNFRTNKSKIESILKKDVSLIKENSQPEDISMTKDSTQTDFAADTENSILSAPESSVDRMNQIGLEERDDNTLKVLEESEHKTKPRGFNFKNPHRKSMTEKRVENPVQEEVVPQSENIDPTPVEDKTQADISKAETKKLKGFNFRNPGKVKNE